MKDGHSEAKKRRGWGLILPALHPSLPLPSLFSVIATPHISARIVSCNRASGGAGSPSWIPMLQNMPQSLPKCLWSVVAKGKRTQAEQLRGCQSYMTDMHISNPFTVIEESRLKCNCRLRPPVSTPTRTGTRTTAVMGATSDLFLAPIDKREEAWHSLYYCLRRNI